MSRNADQRLEELFLGLSNYERTRQVPVAWSLDTMRALLAALGVGESLPGTWVQVAGSKGKGTTVLYLEAMARAAGLATGAFLSPHLHHVTERVLLDGRPVAATILAAAMERVVETAADHGLSLSFFEAITAAAVVVFREAGCELVALEVGLGGRLDATTAVPVDATVITRIELEHTELLGDTVEAIAVEKAGAMRPGKPAWVLADPAVDAVFAAQAARVGVADLTTVRIVDARSYAADGGPVPLWIEDGSAFERPAAALAHACLVGLLPDLAIATDPVVRPVLPGRFEVVATAGGTFVLDGAHTEASCREVAAELCRRFPAEPVAVLFATAVGKLWREELSELLPVADRFFVTTLEGTPGVPAAEVVDWLRNQGARSDVVRDPAAGLAALSGCAAIRLVVGSFYLVGAVRPLIPEKHD